MSDLRKVFFEELRELAQKDERIVLVVNDVGWSFFDEFKKEFPKQFLNLGITEQSIVGVCAGLALEGKKPYYYSMINFVVFRPFEQVRNDVALQKLDVKFIAVKGSHRYRFLGESHNEVFENEGEYHMKPYMKCYIPKTEDEAKLVLHETYNDSLPAYIQV